MTNIHDDLKINIDAQKARIEMDKGSIIVVGGQTGEGKTTLAVQIADYYQGSEISFEKQIATGGSQYFIKKPSIIEEKLKVMIFDEAGELIGKRAMSNFNLKMIQDFEQQRAFQIFVIMCLPSFRSLDPSLFDERGLVRFAIQVHSRSETLGKWNLYGRKAIKKLFYEMKDKPWVLKDHFFDPRSKYYVIPDADGSFYDLDPGRRAELKTYSIEGKVNLSRERKAKEEGLLTYEEIGSQVKRTKSSLYHYFSKEQIKPIDRIGNVAYFDPSVVEQIRQRKKAEEGDGK